MPQPLAGQAPARPPRLLPPAANAALQRPQSRRRANPSCYPSFGSATAVIHDGGRRRKTGTRGSRLIPPRPDLLQSLAASNMTRPDLHAIRGYPSVEAPLPQKTATAFSTTDWFWIGGGFSAAVAGSLLLFYLLHRWATQPTLPPPGGVTEEQIQALKNVTYAAPTEEEGAQPDECSICLDEFEDGEVLKQLPCHHVFHLDCACTALLLKGECPVCRAAVANHGSSASEFDHAGGGAGQRRFSE